MQAKKMSLLSQSQAATSADDTVVKDENNEISIS